MKLAHAILEKAEGKEISALKPPGGRDRRRIQKINGRPFAEAIRDMDRVPGR